MLQKKTPRHTNIQKNKSVRGNINTRRTNLSKSTTLKPENLYWYSIKIIIFTVSHLIITKTSQFKAHLSNLNISVRSILQPNVITV